MTKPESKSPSSQTAQPLFFKDPVPIQKDVHQKSGLSVSENYEFSKPTNSVPINIQEFAFAAKTYPIVFTADNSATPVAVVGLKESLNLFVTSGGKWEKNCYVPGYVRQYPFVFMSEKDRLILCVDHASDRFKKNAGDKDLKFFDKDAESEVTKSALQFCFSYYQDQLLTRQFAASIQEQGLLIDRQVNVSPAGKIKPVSLGGFRIIDEEKLKTLSEPTIIDWFKKGYLALISFHLQSMTNWQNLVDRVYKAKN